MISSAAMQVLLFLVLFLSAMLYLARRHQSVGHWSGKLVSTLTGINLFLLAAYLVADYFTNKGIDESVIYHVRSGLGGAGLSEFSWLIVLTAVLAICSTGIPWLIWKKTAGNRRRGTVPARLAPVALMLVATLANPAVGNLYQFSQPPESDLALADFHRAPGKDIVLGPRKNVIFIYLEGLERAFLDGDVFPGLTPGLNALLSQHTSFSDISQPPHTGWTIAGMIASQCGLPTHFPSHGNSLDGLDRILPDSTCLGDVLNRNGYRVSFFGGADNRFAGKGTFLLSHGFREVNGRDELAPRLKDPSYQSGWGLFDDSMLELAFDGINGLANGPEPYAVFILTLDTHFPNGHPSKTCGGTRYRDGDEAMLDAIACTDLLVSAFIERLRNLPGIENTLVFVLSDHLMMGGPPSPEHGASPRKNLFAVLDLSNPHPRVIDTPGTILDIAPTVLGFLGADTAFGLGRNLLAHPSVARTVPGFDQAIRAWGPELQSMWSFPNLGQGLTIDAGRGEVRVGQRNFRTPLIIEFDKRLNSRLYFEFDSEAPGQDLKFHYRSLPADSGVIWVDGCNRISRPDTRQPGAQCVLLGRKGLGEIEVRELSAERYIGPAELEVF